MSTSSFRDPDESGSFESAGSGRSSGSGAPRESSDDPDDPPRPPGEPMPEPDIVVSVLPGTERRIFVAEPPVGAVSTRWLVDRLGSACRLIEPRVDRLGVLLVDDAHMRSLHQQHLGIAETTDVLTFPWSGPGQAIEADVAVCVDEAERQARRRGSTTAQEVLLYALHGVLHCAGFDDHDSADFEAMHREEDRILRAIGVGETFRRKRRGAAGVGEEEAT